MSAPAALSGSKVSVVIPVLNAGPYLKALLDALLAQQPEPPREIILVDSNSTDNTRELASAFPAVRVIPVPNFSHGRARNMGVREAKGEIVALMTQDALPRDSTWLASLLEPFADPKVGSAYSRQTPRPDAPLTEVYFLGYHFPDGPGVRREKHGSEALSFQTVFFSNVSAAIRRDLLLRFPFDEKLIMSEDQQFSRDIMNAGFAVVYQPKSVVIHSHKYSLKSVFQRYFDSVYSLTVIFRDHGMNTSASIGLRYLRKESIWMLTRHPLRLPYYALYVMVKASATVAGHFAEQMPDWLLRRLSMHSYHWRRAAAQEVRIKGSGFR